MRKYSNDKDRHGSIPLFALCKVGWSVMVLHASALFTPLMYLASLLHTGCTGKTSAVVGSLLACAQYLFIAGMEFSVTVTAELFYSYTKFLTLNFCC